MSYGVGVYGETSYGELAGELEKKFLAGEGITFTGALINEIVGSNNLESTLNIIDAVGVGDAWYYSAVSSLTFEALYELSEGFAASESLLLAPALDLVFTASQEVADALTLQDRSVIQFDAQIADGVTFADTQAYDNALAVVEQLRLTGAQQTQMQAIQTVADAIVLADAGGFISAENVAEAVDLSAAIAAQLMAYELHSSTVNVATDATNTLYLYTTDAEVVNFEDTQELAQQLSNLIEQGIEFTGSVRLGTDVYAAWVLNPATASGVSRYDNFPFNSLATSNEKFYGAADDGIYLISGDDDDGTNIDISIKTGLLDFGERRSKRVHDVFLGVRTSGDLVLKVTADEQGVRTEAWYEVVDHGEQDNHRAKVGKGLRGVYWGWELVNVDGADVDLDNLQLYPLTLSRRV